MKFETMEIVKNFGSINANLIFRKGDVLRTISDQSNVLARAVLDDTIPRDFGIYDVHQFISAYSLVENGSVDFHDNSLTFTNGSSSINYFYSNIEQLTEPPENDPKMPEADVKFILTQEILNQLRRASAALGHKSVVIQETDDGSVSLSIVDPKNATSNIYSVDVEGEFLETDLPGRLSINIENLKLLPGDYEVEVSSKKVSKFQHTEKELTYWVSLEKD